MAFKPFGKGGKTAAPSAAMSDAITKKKHKKGFGMKKAPHPKLGYKKPVMLNLGTPFLNE